MVKSFAQMLGEGFSTEFRHVLEGFSYGVILYTSSQDSERSQFHCFLCEDIS